MNKDDLTNQLTHTKDNYIMGLAALTLFSTEDSYPLLNTHLAVFGKYSVTFDQLTTLLQNPADRDVALKEFLKMLMRTLIKESFEHIKDYCQATNQYSAFKTEPWYEFARLIRNFLSHNCRFEFNKYDADRLPIAWRQCTITMELHKKSPDLSFFGEVETWELFKEFENFVQNRLE